MLLHRVEGRTDGVREQERREEGVSSREEEGRESL